MPIGAWAAVMLEALQHVVLQKGWASRRHKLLIAPQQAASLLAHMQAVLTHVPADRPAATKYHWLLNCKEAKVMQRGLRWVHRDKSS